MLRQQESLNMTDVIIVAGLTVVIVPLSFFIAINMVMKL